MEQLPFQNVDFLSSCLNLARTTPSTIIKVLDILTQYQPNGTLVDLGCGEGQFVIEAGKRGFISTGVELDRQLVAAASRHSSPTVVFINQDIFTLELESFDIIYCYLYESTLRKLSPRLIDRLRRRKGLVVSLLYSIPHLNPIHVDDTYQIFVYDTSSF
jgi:SAM-dependent methyltransferase